jgi:hypothetical protein
MRTPFGDATNAPAATAGPLAGAPAFAKAALAVARPGAAPDTPPVTSPNVPVR